MIFGCYPPLNRDLYLFQGDVFEAVVGLEQIQGSTAGYGVTEG